MVKSKPSIVRMEYELDEGSAAKVMERLKVRYPRVEFTSHTTMNGFYARGTREELLAIRRELAPKPSTVPDKEFLKVDGDLADVCLLLKRLAPGCTYTPVQEHGVIVVKGPAYMVDQVRELAVHRCLEFDQTLTDFKLLDVSAEGLKTLGITLLPLDSHTEIRREFVNGEPLSELP